MQQRLLSEGASLSLEKAIDISLSLESAIKQAAVIQSECKPPSEAVSKIEQKISRSEGTKCFRCDNVHNPKLCPFIDKQCFFCGNKGHTHTHAKFAERKLGQTKITLSNSLPMLL